MSVSLCLHCSAQCHQVTVSVSTVSHIIIAIHRDMITDSREDLTNSVAAAVKEQKAKFRGLDCNRGTKTKAAMKR